MIRPALVAIVIVIAIHAGLQWVTAQHRATLMAGFDALYEKLAADEAAKIIFEPRYAKQDIDA